MMNDDLLVKYLAGEADDRERLRVEDWLRRNEENARHYRQLKGIWDESEKLAPETTPDEDAAWERFRERMRHQDAARSGGPRQVRSMSPPHTGGRRQPGRRWLRAAAVLALLFTAGWAVRYLLQERTAPPVVRLASGQEVREETLPDGSVVTLNKNSLLSYPRKFRGPERSVTLEGEAFFSVEPDKDKPFIISVNELKVQVTGTSFNVKSRNGITEVIVETGSVKVSRSGEEIALRPGEKTVSAGKGDALTKEPARNMLYKYYRTKEFVCNGTPLLELANTLGEAYGVRILIPDTTLGRQPITTVFRDESLDQILKVISQTFDISVRYEKEQIILER